MKKFDSSPSWEIYWGVNSIESQILRAIPGHAIYVYEGWARLTRAYKLSISEILSMIKDDDKPNEFGIYCKNETLRKGDQFSD